MSTLVISACLADASAGSACCHRPFQQQQQQQHRRGGSSGLCLGNTSPQQFSICAIPLGRSVLGLRRGAPRGPKLTRRSFQGGTRAASETEERPSRANGNGRAAGGLDELDNQLRVLSSSDNLLSASKEATKDIAGNEEKLPRKDDKKVDWPVFGDGFVLYISVGLILLTIVNNVLFRIFLGPPVPRDPPRPRTELPRPPSETKAREPFKLRSFNDPKYFYNAPSVTDEPVS